jgi:hypothetical protein
MRSFPPLIIPRCWMKKKRKIALRASLESLPKDTTLSLRPPPSALRRSGPPPFPPSVLRPPPSVLRPPSPPSALRPPPSALRPPPSALRPPPSALRPPPSVLRPPSSALRPPSSVLRPPLEEGVLRRSSSVLVIPPPSALRPPPSEFLRPPSSVLLPSSALRPPSSIAAAPSVPTPHSPPLTPHQSTCDIPSKVLYDTHSRYEASTRAHVLPLQSPVLERPVATSGQI